MTERKHLPNDRPGITHKVEIEGHDIYITASVWPGTVEVGEVFIRVGKVGSTMNGTMDLLGLGMSLLLQYGMGLDELTRKYQGLQFEPYGRTSNKDIPMCKSIADYLAQWLRKEFLEADPVKIKAKLRKAHPA
jgi:ribonucleoside-diphosphate reductase alpha chain